MGQPHTHHLEQLLLAVLGMATVIVVKLALFAFARKAESSAVQAYA